MIHCNLSFPNPLTHLISIEITFPKVKKGSFEIILPAWRPGRYELADYTQNVSPLVIKDTNDHDVVSTKTKPNVWFIENPEVQDLRISYQYYANKMDAGNSVVNNEQVYINFINCVLYSESYLSNSIEIHIELPANYHCATSLLPVSKNTYQAKHYDELVDSPILASDQLHQIHYTVDDYNFNIVFMGSHPLEDAQIIKQFKAFTQKQIQDMEGFPCQDYYFLIQSLPYKHYHGVEHQNSTVLVLGTNTEDNKVQYEEMLLGVASHELFHTWNVTRIRPKELSPYNFKQEVLFDTGFVAEGFTTYYGDYYLKTSGVFTIHAYFKEVNTLLKRHFENYGRSLNSLTQSSMNLWGDGYKNIVPSKKVSIYVKGALNALIIDLHIRKVTNNTKSLVDVMKVMHQKYTFGQGGYTKEDVYNIVEQIATVEVSSLLQLLSESTATLEPYLTEALGYVGCILINTSTPSVISQRLGVRLTDSTISDIDPESVSYEKLSIGDQILSINGQKSDEITELGETILLDILRNGKEMTIQLLLDDQEYFQSYTIAIMQSSSEVQKNNFNLWLNNIV